MEIKESDIEKLTSRDNFTASLQFNKEVQEFEIPDDYRRNIQTEPVASEWTLIIGISSPGE